jgi:hypothetical protein
MNGEIIAMMAQGSLPAARLDEPMLGPAPPADVARFADAMGSRVAPEPAVSGVSAIEQGSLLDSIRNVGLNYAQLSGEMKGILARGPSDVGAFDLVKLQLQMVDTSMMVELVSRTVQKATQNIDQLSKLQ